MSYRPRAVKYRFHHATAIRHATNTVGAAGRHPASSSRPAESSSFFRSRSSILSPQNPQFLPPNVAASTRSAPFMTYTYPAAGFGPES